MRWTVRELMDFITWCLVSVVLTIASGLLLILLTMLWAERADAYTPTSGLTVLDPTKVSVEYFRLENNRDDYLRINERDYPLYDEDSTEYWAYGMATQFNIDVIKYGQYAVYWDNTVHMDATNCCVRHVGWQYELGAHLGPHLDVFYYHHSRHILDLDRDTKFPLINRVGFRLILVEEGRK